MAPHSSTLAWKIPWTEEPGRLQSMESLRVRHDWTTSLSLFTFMHWRRKWQPTPVFLPGESQGRGSLVGCRLWHRVRHDWSDLAAYWVIDVHASKMNIDVYELVNTKICPKLCQQRRPGSNGTSVAMSISWSQILVSKSHLPIKET